MHELGIMTSVMDAVTASATEAGADRITKVSLRVGVMTEAIEDALRFAFEALCEGSEIARDAQLEVTMVEPVSVCPSCGEEFAHDRFHRLCPECGNPFTELIQGKELEISSIEVEFLDEDEEPSHDATNAQHPAPAAE